MPSPSFFEWNLKTQTSIYFWCIPIPIPHPVNSNAEKEHRSTFNYPGKKAPIQQTLNAALSLGSVLLRVHLMELLLAACRWKGYSYSGQGMQWTGAALIKTKYSAQALAISVGHTREFAQLAANFIGFLLSFVWHYYSRKNYSTRLLW